MTHRTLKLLALSAPLALTLSACGDKDGGGPDESWRFEKDPDAGGPLGDNGTFTFEPGPAGAAPGYYVVATVDGQELRSDELEVLLEEHPSLTEGDTPKRNDGAPEAPAAGDWRPDEPVEDPAATGFAHLLDNLPEGDARLPRDVIAEIDAPATIRFEQPATGLYRPMSTDALRLGALVGVTPSAALPKSDDFDRDGVLDDEDNCRMVANAAQDDEDEDGVGDSCETDFDGDGILDDGDDSGDPTDNPCDGTREDCDDNCPEARNPRQLDTDGDGIGDLCDGDRDGNGTPDLDEATDWDGDGISTAAEGSADSDGDGIPDAFDADDDNDTIPTADERGNDTDNDGIPDDRDTDSDDDGIPDVWEPNRDSDRDGIPDSRDTDDDNDGSPTADEIGPDHIDPNGNLVPRWLDPTEDENTEPCDTVNPRDAVPTIDTFGGTSPWVVAAFDFSFAGVAHAYGWAFHVAPNGIYVSLQSARGAVFPPELAAASRGLGVGYIHPPEAPDLHASTIEGYATSLSASFGFASLGFTIFHKDDFRPHRALQADIGVGISTSLISFPFGIALMRGRMSLRTEDDGPAFVFVHGWAPGCAPSNKANGSSLDALDAQIAAAAGEPVTDLMSGLRASTAQSLAPLTAMMTESGSSPAEGIPASTNGAWIGDFAGRNTTAVCRDCADMSIDGIIRDAHYRLLTAGEESGSLIGVAAASTSQALRAWPNTGQHALLNDMAMGAVDATFAHAYENTARINGSPNRYVADEVRTISARIGEPVSFEYTAQEVADLVNADVDDVLGATICMRSDFSGPRADDTCGALTDAGVRGELTLEEITSILYEVSVDLTTANGDFDGALVETWTVRLPALLITTEAGDPDRVVFSAPASIWSGAPTTLAARVVDAAGMPVDVPVSFAFYGPGDVLLGEVDADTGSATYQTVPEGVTPSVDDARIAEVTFSDGTTVDGLVIEGAGLSGASTIRVNGQDVTERGYVVGWIDSHAIVATPDTADATLLTSGSARVEVISPGGATSGAAQYDL